MRLIGSLRMPLSKKGVAHYVLFHYPSYTDLALHDPHLSETPS